MPLKISKNLIVLPYQGTGLSVPLPLLVPASVLVAATRSPRLEVFDNDATSFSKLDILCCILEIFASYSFSDAFILLRSSVSDVKFFALSSVICNQNVGIYFITLICFGKRELPGIYLRTCLSFASNWLSFILICFWRCAIFSLSCVTATTWSELFGSCGSCIPTIRAAFTGVGPFVSPPSDCGGNFVTSTLCGLLLWPFNLQKESVKHKREFRWCNLQSLPNTCLA